MAHSWKPICRLSRSIGSAFKLLKSVGYLQKTGEWNTHLFCAKEASIITESLKFGETTLGDQIKSANLGFGYRAVLLPREYSR